MADQSRLHPDDEDLRLARLLEPASDTGRPGPDDPLLPFLEAYKERVVLRSHEEADEETWRAVKDGIARSERKSSGVHPAVWKAAAIILVTLATGIFMLLYQTEEPQLLAQSGDQRVELTLRDGTSVMLRPNSALYALKEMDHLQHYRISGEARFDVVSDPGREFSVSAGLTVVKVTGTLFTLAGYGDYSRVYLQSGSVHFSAEDADPVKLSPGEYSEFRNGVLREPAVAGERVFTGWTEGVLVLDQKRLADLADEISHHFNIKVTIPGEYRNEQLGGTLLLDNHLYILEDIGQSLGGRFIETEPGHYLFTPTP